MHLLMKETRTHLGNSPAQWRTGNVQDEPETSYTGKQGAYQRLMGLHQKYIGDSLKLLPLALNGTIS